MLAVASRFLPHRQVLPKSFLETVPSLSNCVQSPDAYLHLDSVPKRIQAVLGGRLCMGHLIPEYLPQPYTGVGRAALIIQFTVSSTEMMMTYTICSNITIPEKKNDFNVS